MVFPFIFLVCVVLTVYMAVKHDKWKYMLASFVLVALVVLMESGILDTFIDCIVDFLKAKRLQVEFVALLITFILTAAMWNRNRLSKQTDERVRKIKFDYLETIPVAGFIEENVDLQKTGWEKYIKTLSERLAKTRPNGESFALGIAGDWGSGKTTFLNQLRSQLERSFQVIDFNPWVCTDAHVVIAEFFNTLKTNFPKSDKELISDIGHYVRLLTDVDILPKSLASLVEVFSKTSSNSVTALKTEIENKLKKADNRYAVLIDDLDRLQHDELFEILRLIRITASFSNIIFVVTYDRHHIQAMLQQHGISDGSQYVKKIFNTELILPGVEPYTLPMMLNEEIESLLGRESHILATISGAIFQKSNFETYDLLCYLKNFRDVKRFAMAFVTNVTTVESYPPGEFSFTDYFWLEILRYIDNDSYCILRVNPQMFLTLSNQILKVKDVLNVADETKRVLNQLFSSQDGRPQNSIVYMHNFHNYFCYRIQDNKLSHFEFHQLLETNNMSEMQGTVGAIFAQRKLPSLVELIKNISVSQLSTEQEKRNYITLMYAIISSSGYSFISVIKDKMQKCKCASCDLEALTAHAKRLLHDLVHQSSTQQRGYINILLASLHSVCHFNYMDELPVCIDYESIIDDEFLVKESEANLRAILSARNKPLDITNVTTCNSNLRRFLENATVEYETDVTYEPEESHYKCLPFNVLLEYCSQNPSDKLDQFMEPFTFKEYEMTYIEIEDIRCDRLHKIEKIFGSLNNFALFTYKCFTNSEEEKDRWIVENWKIEKPEIIVSNTIE